MKLGTIIGTNRPLRVNLDALVESRALITAQSGGGKSWLLRLLLEQTHGKIQHIVIDLEGEFPSLREKFDYVLIGKGGDRAAHPREAGDLARSVLELQFNVIIDLSELKVPGRRQYVKTFLEGLVNVPRKLWRPALVVIDEAHQFCPQKQRSESAAAVVDLLARGRKRGLCAVLATQRLAKLDKDAAAECGNVLVGRTVMDVDRARAVDALAIVSGAQKGEISQALMRLPAGEFYSAGVAFQPDTLTRLKVGGVKTKHPQIGRGQMVAPTPPPSQRVRDVLARLDKISEDAEEEANEVVRLRTRVRELQAELRVRPVEKVGATDEEVAGYLSQRDLAWEGRLTEALGEVARYREALKLLPAHVAAIAKALDGLPKDFPKIDPPDRWQVQDRVAAGAQRQPIRPAPKRTIARQSPPLPAIEGEYRPRAGARRMLEALARYPSGRMTESQLRTMARLKKSGTSSTYVSELLRNGLVERDGKDLLITDEGLALVGVAAATPLTAAETLEEWRKCFRAGERRMLDALVEDGGRGMTREQLGEAAELEPTSGTFGTYLGVLKRNGLAVERDGVVRLAEFLLDARA